MRIYDKSSKLDDVCYDVRGPVLEEANRMQQEGEFDKAKGNLREGVGDLREGVEDVAEDVQKDYRRDADR